MDDKDFQGILDGVGEASAFVAGKADPAGYRIHIPARIDVAALRKKLGLTQVQFAARFGFKLGTLRDWEQGRFAPEPTARVLLTIIDREPAAVARALAAA
ncbi:MAG: helix-turn-helix domain-containing protein [Caulobacter sp.]